ncbi:MAG: Gldg family protein [Deltaproteobacteria bacterium]|nr:Gldg family protein [Deltaproteobacteria bacterium]
MNGARSSNRYIKFFIYLIVVVLVNMAGITLFFRLDLTRNRIYSISETSRTVVSTLSEPLTINVFFSRNLPAPHNNTERYLHDLLEEYANYANRHFNYRFYDVSVESGDTRSGAKQNQDLARNYGVFPVQIQAVEKDEIKFQKAYMGLVLIHGDMIERIPTITGTDGLEYRLTTAIQKLNNKVSALLNLKEKIKIHLVLSSSLQKVAPLMNLENLGKIPQQVEDAVAGLNDKAYGKLEYLFLDPTRDPESAAALKPYNIMTLQWPEMAEKKIQAGSGSIGLLMLYGDKAVSVPLLRVIRIPIIGTQYELTDMARIEEILDGHIESLIDINENVGVLAGFGSVPVSPPPPPSMGMPQDPNSATSFYALISQNYTVKNIALKEEPLPNSLNCLIIPGPKEKMTDYELFQIDQFLMKGKNLAVFMDAFNEINPQNQQGLRLMNQQGPVYIPTDTGLEKLLEHYGVRMSSSYVLDENCFKQKVPAQFGGGEQPIYFAPMIKNKNITNEFEFMRTIKGLVAVKMSPLSLIDDRLNANGIKATRLLATSEKSWEMKGRINLNPMFLQPPSAEDELQSFPIAYLLEGNFSSYFEGRSIPEKEMDTPAQPENTEGTGDGSGEASAEGDKERQPKTDARIEGSQDFIAKGKPGKILLISSTEMIKDNILDSEGRSPNDMLVMNLVDYLNNREGLAIMRSKEQRFNPLNDVGVGLRTFVKSFNIIGLPVLVAIFGLFVLLRRHARKRRIQAMFQ